MRPRLRYARTLRRFCGIFRKPIHAKSSFFSRGRGRGHAIPDMAIADQLTRVWPELELHFVSYSTGADTFRRRGLTVIDMSLPEENPFFSTLIRCKALIDEWKPDFIVSHEEFSAMVAASMAGVKSIFLSAWFPPKGSVAYGEGARGERGIERRAHPTRGATTNGSARVAGYGGQGHRENGRALQGRKAADDRTG